MVSLGTSALSRLSRSINEKKSQNLRSLCDICRALPQAGCPPHPTPTPDQNLRRQVSWGCRMRWRKEAPVLPDEERSKPRTPTEGIQDLGLQVIQGSVG